MRICKCCIIFSLLMLGAVTSNAQERAEEDWCKGMYLKTNTPALAAGVANAAVEVDFARHWSVAIPVYYCAWNHFKETIKFRTLAAQPEVRFWAKEDNEGFFAGGHFGYGYYNLAFDGNFRYQDQDGKSPAIGGGISVGYRLPISRNNRWHLEFAVGGGVYALKYDRFYNVANGKLADTHCDIYWGADNASISVAYRFELKKRRK